MFDKWHCSRCCESCCLCGILLFLLCLVSTKTKGTVYDVITCVVSKFVCPMREDSNLVDSASSHTLVSKIKPCMSKYKSLTLKLRTAHYISYSLFDSPLLFGIPVVILELIHALIHFLCSIY